jgi:hypothetical protein
VRSWRDDAQTDASLEQAADLIERDGAGADQEAGASVELEEDGQQLISCILSRLRCAARGRWVDRALRRRGLLRPVGRAVRRWCGGQTRREDSRQVAASEIVLQQALDRFGHQRCRAAIAHGASHIGVLTDGSAEAEIIGVGEFAVVLDLFAFDADVGDPMLAATVGAAGDVEAKLLVELGTRSSSSSTSQRAKPLVSVMASLQNSVPVQATVPRQKLVAST